MVARGSIAVAGVGKSIGATDILFDLSLEVEAGTFVTLLGPSGCGKTTLLRLIAGFAEPTKGEIRIDGRPMRGVPPRERPIGMVFQNLALFPHLDVFANVAYGLKLRGMAAAETKSRVERFLDLVGMAGFGARRISQISGGQKQRVALARSLVLEPSILLLDEPLSALDLQLRRQMQAELKKIQKRVNTTFVFVTHDQEEAAVLSDRIVVMERGRIRQTGTPREIYRQPRSHFVAQFIGDINLLPGTVAETAGGHVTVETLGQRVTVATDTAPPPAQPCIIGFRPEDVALADEEDPGPGLTFRARVTDLSWTGATGRLHAMAGEHAVNLVLLAAELEARAAHPGETVTLTVPAARIHVFPRD